MATGRAALLQWAQNTTRGYKGVDVKDFSMSFKDGLAFCAIVHHYHPNALNFDSLKASNMLENNRTAFKAAEKLGVPPLLDAEDMVIPKPEPHSVMTYLMQMHSVFVKGQAAGTGWGLGGDNKGQGKPQQSNNAPNPASSPAKGPAPSSQLRQNQNRGTMQAPNCAGCGQPLRGDVVEFQNSLFHGPCFKCCQCSKVLKACYPINNQPYCEGCARAEHSKRMSQRGAQPQPPPAQPPQQQNRQPTSQHQPTASQQPARSPGFSRSLTQPQQSTKSNNHHQAPALPPSNTTNLSPRNEAVAKPDPSRPTFNKFGGGSNAQLSQSQPARSNNLDKPPSGVGPPGSPSYIKAQQQSGDAPSNGPKKTAVSGTQQQNRPFSRSMSTVEHTTPYKDPYQAPPPDRNAGRSTSFSGGNRGPALPPAHHAHQQTAPPPLPSAYQQPQPAVPPALPAYEQPTGNKGLASSQSPRLPPQPRPQLLRESSLKNQGAGNAPTLPPSYAQQAPPALPPAQQGPPLPGSSSSYAPPPVPTPYAQPVPPVPQYDQPASPVPTPYAQPVPPLPLQNTGPALPPPLPSPHSQGHSPLPSPHSQQSPLPAYNQAVPPLPGPSAQPAVPPLPAQNSSSGPTLPPYQQDPYSTPPPVPSAYQQDPSPPVPDTNYQFNISYGAPASGPPLPPPSQQPAVPPLPETNYNYATSPAPPIPAQYDQPASPVPTPYSHPVPSPYQEASAVPPLPVPDSYYNYYQQQASQPVPPPLPDAYQSYPQDPYQSPVPVPSPSPRALPGRSQSVSNPFLGRNQPAMPPPVGDHSWEEFTSVPVVPTASFSYDEYLSSTILQGTLKKWDLKTMGLSITSKKYWFNLRAERLLYWNQQPTNEGKTPEGVISLRYAQRVEAKGTLGFCIVLPERVYELEAENTNDKLMWMDGIQKAIQTYHKIQQYIGDNEGLSRDNLRKEGSLLLKMGIFGWVEHHFILVDGMLFIYLGKGGPRLYKLPMYGIGISPLIPDANSKTTRFGFHLTTEGGVVYQICSLNSVVIDDWKDTITRQKANIEAAINDIVL